MACPTRELASPRAVGAVDAPPLDGEGTAAGPAAAGGLRWAALALVAAALVALGLWPDAVPQWFAGQDKLHHVLGLLAFGVALCAVFPGLTAWRYALACVAVGGGIELAQVLLSARTASLADFGADLLGAALGWWAWWLLRRRAVTHA